jgi:hypothetical protein
MAITMTICFNIYFSHHIMSLENKIIIIISGFFWGWGVFKQNFARVNKVYIFNL